MAKTTAEYTGEFSAKKMLMNAVGQKMRYRDRMKVEILQDTTYYKKGQIINSSKVKGQALIDQGLARKVKTDD